MGTGDDREPSWGRAELDDLRTVRELSIAARRPDGSLRDPVPIRVVVADDQVLVRAWHPRDTGRYGSALHSGRARVRIAGEEVEVALTRIRLGPQSGGRRRLPRAVRRGGSPVDATPEAVSSSVLLVAEG